MLRLIDRTLKTVTDGEKILNYVLLGVIPHFELPRGYELAEDSAEEDGLSSRRIITLESRYPILSSAYQMLPANLRFISSDEKLKAIARQRPMQGVYLIDHPVNPGLKESVSAFAFKVKNLVRPLGLAQLGLPCLLTGTGVALLWSGMTTVNLSSGSIVEDMKLGFDLAIAGTPPALCPSVTVVRPLPPSDATAKVQRTRWEHGHLQLITRAPIYIFGRFRCISSF